MPEFFAHERLVEPVGPQVARAVADQDGHAALAETAGGGADLLDDAPYALRTALFEIGDGPFVGQVLVVAREIEEQMARGAEAEALEELGAAGADAADELDGRGKQAFGFGGGGGVVHRRILHVNVVRIT